jgi:hypothetical protein
MRGAAVRHELWPLLRHFYGLFPITLSDAKFDGLRTVGDLYAVLCRALKLKPKCAADGTDRSCEKTFTAAPESRYVCMVS